MARLDGVIDGYPRGSDITLMNVMYNYPSKDQDGHRVDDFLTLVYKDNKTGEKHHQVTYNPKFTFYKIKDGEEIPDHPLFFIEKDKVEPITTEYSKLEKTIAEVTDNMAFYNKNVMDRNMRENKKLHMHPAIFFSDTSIEDHYRFLFAKQYTNNIGKLHKAFYDIECDTIHMAGDFVKSGECPINMVSLHDEERDIIVSFILRNYENPLIQQFEDEIARGRFTEKDIHDFVTDCVGGYKQSVRLKLDKTHFKLLFFDDELEMIKTFFQMVHMFDPDFIEGWNSSSFDLQYFIDRIIELGEIPAHIMCNPDFEVQVVKNYIDQRNINDFAERGDFAEISGHPVWLDQMIQYASRRKSKIGSFKSFKLDDIGHDAAKVRKLSYAHITNDIAQLPYLDFKTFVLYNIMDVVVQKCIETKTQDLEYIFSKCIVNCTSYKKGHRQTVYLINRMGSEFWDMDFVIGTNNNKYNKAPEDKFLGALVGNPLNTDDYSKIKIGGRSVMICDNLDDFDYKSLYPSILGEFNIAPNTQIGRIDIPNQVYDRENFYNNDKYTRGSEFVENLTVDNIIEFCNRWLCLGGILDVLADIKEYSARYTYGAPYNKFAEINGKLVTNALYDIDDSEKGIDAITEDYGPKPAIYVFSNLQENGLSNNYNVIVGNKDD